MAHLIRVVAGNSRLRRPQKCNGDAKYREMLLGCKIIYISGLQGGWCSRGGWLDRSSWWISTTAVDLGRWTGKTEANGRRSEDLSYINRG